MGTEFDQAIAMAADVRRLADELASRLEAARALADRLESLANVGAVKPAEVIAPAQTSSVPEPLIETFCAYLEATAQSLISCKLSTDPSKTAFLTRVRPVLRQAAIPEREQRLLEVLGFIDDLGAAHPGSAYGPLQVALQEARRLVQACLPGLRLVQAEAPATEVPGPALPMDRPLVLATGVIHADGHEISSPRLLHVEAAPPPWRRAAWGLVDEMLGILATRWGRSLREDCDRALAELCRDQAGDHLTLLRSLLNLHTRHLETAATPAAAAVIGLLHEHGLRSLTLSAGDRFDPDRHDHRRYERLVHANPGQPPGTVLALRQVGLLDTAGLPVQKCLVVTA